MLFQFEREELVASTFALPNQVARIPTRITFLATALLVSLLGLRFLLLLAGASPEAPFVLLLYALTQPFLVLFEGAFAPLHIAPGYILEYSTLLAMVVYVAAAWFLTQWLALIAQLQHERSRLHLPGRQLR